MHAHTVSQSVGCTHGKHMERRKLKRRLHVQLPPSKPPLASHASIAHTFKECLTDCTPPTVHLLEYLQVRDMPWRRVPTVEGLAAVPHITPGVELYMAACLSS